MGKKRTDAEDVKPLGKFILSIDNITSCGIHTNFSCKWKRREKGMSNCDVPYRFVSSITKYVHENGWHDGFTVHGFTSCKINLFDRVEQIRAASSIHGDGEWYD